MRDFGDGDPWGDDVGLPPPPANLHERELPLVAGTAAEGPWARMHARGLHPVFFGTTGDGRFDDPLGEYGVLYAAEDEHGAFIESFGRAPGRNIVSWEKLRARPLAELAAERALRLVDLTGSGLARIGATSEIFSGDHVRAQEWSRALHEHPEKPDGLRYRLRHDPDRIGVAIFGRAEALIRSSAAGTLLGAGRRKLLAAILKEYRFGLVGGPYGHE